MALALTTTSVSETLNLGEVLGQSISAPMVIALTGDLGSAKQVETVCEVRSFCPANINQ